MRVMMFVKGDPEPGALPSNELLEEMGRFNEELAKAGVLLDLAGLHPSAEGFRVRFSGGKPIVVDGPFTETKDIVAGYWILRLNSMEEALEWAKRVPVHVPVEYGGEGDVEIRQIFEPEDFDDGPQGRT
ncbi:MAG: YciI family protein [Actinomycetota bacterium]